MNRVKGQIKLKNVPINKDEEIVRKSLDINKN